MVQRLIINSGRFGYKTPEAGHKSFRMFKHAGTGGNIDPEAQPAPGQALGVFALILQGPVASWPPRYAYPREA